MRKAKVIIQEKKNNDKGFVYLTKFRGKEGVCFTMAIGFAVDLAKKSGISLTKIKSLVTDIYKETEENNNGND